MNWKVLTSLFCSSEETIGCCCFGGGGCCFGGNGCSTGDGGCSTGDNGAKGAGSCSGCLKGGVEWYVLWR